MVIKDEKLVAVFRVLRCSGFDIKHLQIQLNKVLEAPYQSIAYGQNASIYVASELTMATPYSSTAEILAFSVWRAITALRNSKALEADVVKHGSNWLVKLDDEPFEVKFVLEDQAQNYLILNSLPALESTVLINDSGWLATAAPEDKFSNEFGDKGVVVESGSGMFEKPISEGYAESLSEVLEQVDQSRSASKALLGEQNPVHNHYENGDDIPTTHTELNSPNLEI